MALNYELVRKGRMEILGVTGTYPSNDNCYKVKVEIVGKAGSSYEDHYCPKPVYHMWKALHEASDFLSRKQVEEILRAFNEHGEWNYYQGGMEESMANSEDL